MLFTGTPGAFCENIHTTEQAIHLIGHLLHFIFARQISRHNDSLASRGDYLLCNAFRTSALAPINNHNRPFSSQRPHDCFPNADTDASDLGPFAL